MTNKIPVNEIRVTTWVIQATNVYTRAVEYSMGWGAWSPEPSIAFGFHDRAIAGMIADGLARIVAESGRPHDCIIAVVPRTYFGAPLKAGVSRTREPRNSAMFDQQSPLRTVH